MINFLTKIQVVTVYNFAGATFNNLPQREDDPARVFPIANGFTVRIEKVKGKLYKCTQVAPAS
jgi:hypothetical protein